MVLRWGGRVDAVVFWLLKKTKPAYRKLVLARRSQELEIKLDRMRAEAGSRACRDLLEDMEGVNEEVAELEEKIESLQQKLRAREAAQAEFDAFQTARRKALAEEKERRKAERQAEKAKTEEQARLHRKALGLRSSPRGRGGGSDPTSSLAKRGKRDGTVSQNGFGSATASRWKPSSSAEPWNVSDAFEKGTPPLAP